VHSILNSINDTFDNFLSLDWRWLVVAFVFQLAIFFFRALAWKTVLKAAYPHVEIRLKDVGAAYAAGVALNAYTPARAGEALKIGLLRLRLSGSSIPALAASSSVILLFDLTVGAVLLAVAWRFGIVPALPQLSLTTGLIAVLIVLVAVAIVAVSPRLRSRLLEGGAILAHPGTYLRRVVPAQLGALLCRLGVVFALLAAYDLPSSVLLAGVVVVAGSISTLVPVTPGGAGTQQVLVVLALQNAVTATGALSFAIGMQVGITVVNTLIGIAGLGLIFGTFRPAAIHAGLRLVRNTSA
jgi:uncharacterized membrane protein YbhN (UPF0104 family)